MVEVIFDLVWEDNDAIFFRLEVAEVILDLVEEEDNVIFCMKVVDMILDLVGEENDVTFDLKVVEVEERFLNDECHL